MSYPFDKLGEWWFVEINYSIAASWCFKNKTRTDFKGFKGELWLVSKLLQNTQSGFAKDKIKKCAITLFSIKADVCMFFGDFNNA